MRIPRPILKALFGPKVVFLKGQDMGVGSLQAPFHTMYNRALSILLAVPGTCKVQESPLEMRGLENKQLFFPSSSIRMKETWCQDW